jgi:hypothetical protein
VGGAHAAGHGGGGARSHCRLFPPPFIHFIPDLLTYSAPLFLNRQFAEPQVAVERGNATAVTVRINPIVTLERKKLLDMNYDRKTRHKAAELHRGVAIECAPRWTPRWAR